MTSVSSILYRQNTIVHAYSSSSRQAPCPHCHSVFALYHSFQTPPLNPSNPHTCKTLQGIFVRQHTGGLVSSPPVRWDEKYAGCDAGRHIELSAWPCGFLLTAGLPSCGGICGCGGGFQQAWSGWLVLAGWRWRFAIPMQRRCALERGCA